MTQWRYSHGYGQLWRQVASPHSHHLSGQHNGFCTTSTELMMLQKLMLRCVTIDVTRRRYAPLIIFRAISLRP